MTGIRELRLPADLCGIVEQKFRRQFASLEELLIFVLQDLSKDEAAHLDQAEERMVEQRLRELGYL